MNETLKLKLANLPSESGCYLFKNKNADIIYIGKAKDLSKRVLQYFQRPHEGRIQKLVSEIVDFDIIVTSNEKEALLLEIDLIKQHRPQYNLMFIDDKTYPMIKITNEPYPQVLYVRERKKDKKAKYFGPYPDARAAREVVSLIHELFPIRKCHRLPSQVCLYYHIHQCDGPCEKLISEADYKVYIDQIIGLLRGQSTHLVRVYQDKMEAAVKDLDFELAALYRDKMQAIAYISERQSGVQFTDHEDIVNFVIDHGVVSLVHFVVRRGKLFEKNAEVFDVVDDAYEEITSAIVHFYNDHPKPKILYVPHELDVQLLHETLDLQVKVPQRGFYKTLLDTVADNARAHLDLNVKASVINIDDTVGLEHLAQLLQLPKVERLEMFDVSHISGQFSVGAMIVYENGGFNKSQYRKYMLHQKNDDVASMEEMIYRRLFRALKEKQNLSDVLLVDGSIGQVQVAKQVVDALQIQMPVIGLSKDKRHETSALVLSDGTQIDLLLEDPLYPLLYKMQEEVHRFVINYHRQMRLKAQTASILDEIDGIGPARKQALMKHFRSFKAIKAATLEELLVVLPKQVALNVVQFFHEK